MDVAIEKFVWQCRGELGCRGLNFVVVVVIVVVVVVVVAAAASPAAAAAVVLFCFVFLTFIW